MGVAGPGEGLFTGISARGHATLAVSDAGAWQAEWGASTDLLRLTGAAAAWARDMLEVHRR